MKGRIERLRAMFDERTDAVLICGGSNRRYLTGFRSPFGWLLIAREACAYFTRDTEIQATRHALGNAIEVLDQSALLSWSIANGICRIAVECEGITHAQFHALARQIQPIEWLDGGEADAMLASLRRIKSPDEIECFRRAQAISDQAFEYILKEIRPGFFDRDLMMKLGVEMVRLGSENTAMTFIFSSGENTAFPHGSEHARIVQRGDFVMMDFGGTYEGYVSDMTRTVAVGEVSKYQREIYEIVREAKDEAIRAIRPGVACRDIDALARGIIGGAGYGDCFTHGLGHAVGLDCHEYPRFAPNSEDVLESGMVITVEPGIYLPGRFGVRIEDMVLVTEDGCENLSSARDALIVV